MFKRREERNTTWLMSVDIARADVDCMSTADESHGVGWKLYILSLHPVLSAPAMPIDVSQVGDALFPFS